MSSTGEPDFDIREYRPADFPAICAIDQACFSEEIAYSPEEMALGLIQRGAFALVAEHDSLVVAFVLASQAKAKVGHIITIDVLSECRGTGVGFRLMTAAEQRLRIQGAERIVLEVATTNDVAIRFYDRFGFAVKRLLPRYYPDGSNAYLMEKQLT
jgi:[ribosomal protein S18]-alanine N-acetyltransferase